LKTGVDNLLMEKNSMKNWKTWSFGILAFATAFVFSGALSSCGSDSAAADVKTGKASLFADATDTVEFDSAPADVFPNPTSAFVP
jgi:hypothetical protein